MSYLSTGTMLEIGSTVAMEELLVFSGGWTWVTALNMMLFFAALFPAGQRCLTIHKKPGALNGQRLVL